MRTLANRLLKLSLVGCAAILGGCDWAVLDPQGQIGADERSIILTATLLMLIVVVPVIAMTFAFAWKYRASNTHAQYMPDWEHSNKIAAVIALVPGVIVLCLGVMTWRTSHTLDPYRPIATNVRPINIEVVALDWKWLFIYPDLQIATVNELAFPANVPVDFRITSASVMNSFFIPQLGGQIYAMAGMQTKLSLIANHQGTYDGMSANYSGEGFSDMKFKAIATSEQAFADWVAKAKQAPGWLDSDSYKALAQPSEKHSVEYFSYVAPDLYQQVLQGVVGEPVAMSIGTPMRTEKRE